jgi:hypothetical protein
MARCYEVVLEIDDDDVRDLRGRACAPAIAKPAGTAPPTVVWFSAPLASRTVFAWDESAYGLYAAVTAPKPSAALDPDGQIYPALPRVRYTFEDGGFRVRAGTSAPEIPNGRYELANGAPVAITAGLVQRATVNGVDVLAPLNAVVLPPGFTAEFAPATKLYVWLQRPAAPGTVIAPAPDHAVEIDLGAPSRTIAYRYDPDGARFVPCEP